MKTNETGRPSGDAVVYLDSEADVEKAKVIVNEKASRFLDLIYKQACGKEIRRKRKILLFISLLYIYIPTTVYFPQSVT